MRCRLLQRKPRVCSLVQAPLVQRQLLLVVLRPVLVLVRRCLVRRQLTVPTAWVQLKRCRLRSSRFVKAMLLPVRRLRLVTRHRLRQRVDLVQVRQWRILRLHHSNRQHRSSRSVAA